MLNRILTVSLVLSQCACAPYLIASTGVGITTGKPVGDHATSLATQYNCDSINLALGKQDYYCEKPREPGTTYNRNAF